MPNFPLIHTFHITTTTITKYILLYILIHTNLTVYKFIHRVVKDIINKIQNHL